VHDTRVIKWKRPSEIREGNKSAASKDFEDDRSFVLLSHPLSLPGGRVYRESLLETIPQVVNNPGARLAFQIYDVIFLCVTDPAGISTAIDRFYTHRACTQRFLRIALLNPSRNEDEIISVALRKWFRNNSRYTFWSCVIHIKKLLLIVSSEFLCVVKFLYYFNYFWTLTSSAW